MHLSRYLKRYSCHERPGHLLLFSTRTAAIAIVPEKVIANIEQGAISPATAETLSRLGFLVPDTEVEAEQVRQLFTTINGERTVATIIAVLNMDCNLACTYCFEGGLKGKRYMDHATAERLVSFLDRHYLAEGIAPNLDFYGGEPLLSLDLIRSITTRLKERAAGRGLSCSFGMVSNGTLLTGDVACELASLGVTGVQVTLDGTRENHDRYRPFVSGKGSFDVIVRNLLEACDLLDISIVCNYTQENYWGFPSLLDYLLEVGLKPERIAAVNFAPISRIGTGELPPEFNDSCASHNMPWVYESQLFLRQEALKRGYSVAKLRPPLCMVELARDLVVTHEGELYKCPAFMGRKGLAVGTLEAGVTEYRESHNLDLWNNEECLDCEYLPFCYGGCRLSRLAQTGEINGVDCRRDYYEASLERYVRQEMANTSRKR
ncbi:Radical SAM domain protein [Geobacter metallireducens RCH3]|uniref:Radical SAM domain iron-sulfur cluster-binding oxidoreductase n=1 Tax=Geobacter metallireducens (strain ATCC 53774 / DSM 7210 / GS-15) TaxID=269799 RepID=Q39W92_GEOMG|nr:MULTISPECIES: geopeptide radical SAM maturase [Geobacter]ABB31482.1 radical SAM domain iron-sulfur cluster-binding oxidoreductase [Geobacter metallireducens GS-15]EHP88429.1 Radical SAM domain protein [Geobacter metallireducens RCH3]MBT1075571.1 geopeptide radical SAM maturase [Geobacter grbiciae]